jgi:DNA polymerase III alpha subunit
MSALRQQRPFAESQLSPAPTGRKLIRNSPWVFSGFLPTRPRRRSPSRYAPAQIVRDARDHGVEIRPVCINASRWDCTLEPIDDDKFAVRLGFRQVRGLSNKDGAEIVAARADRPFESVDDLWRRADVPVSSLVQLAEADAMNESLRLARREALWSLKALRDEAILDLARQRVELIQLAVVRDNEQARRSHATPAPGKLPARRPRKPPHRHVPGCNG